MSTTTVIEEPWDPVENKKYKIYKPAKLGVYNFIGGFVNKNSNARKVINNKQKEEVYKDLNLEIYVAFEHRIRDFIYCFSLNSGYVPTLFLNFLKYDSFLPYPNAPIYTVNTLYQVGNIVRVKTAGGSEVYTNWMCIENHSAGVTIDQSKWIKFDTDLINITKQINASNYTDDFPYVGELVFKNIWGCDVSKRLKTYVKNSSNLLIDYSQILSKNLRESALHYTKFFDRGISKEGLNYGCRFNFGPSLDADEILGSTVLNNYFNVNEYATQLPSDWDYSLDDTLIDNFGGVSLTAPYDHYYLTHINDGIPFFKNKEFKDSYIKLFLEKTDKLGNIVQRIVNLPIHLVFYNNLIKAFKPLITNDYNPETVQTFVAEYKNATNVTYDGLSLSAKLWYLNIFIWCPNCERLNLSSTILGVTVEEENVPQLLYKNGQICLLRWGIDTTQVSVGDKIYATHILEYNDGLNYDKFTLFQEVTISA